MFFPAHTIRCFITLAQNLTFSVCGFGCYKVISIVIAHFVAHFFLLILAIA